MSGVYYNELCTLDEVKQFIDPQSLGGQVDDKLILQTIRSHSNTVERIASRAFVPQVDTRYYDVPRQWNLNPRSGIPKLDLDEDLLELTTLTNGSGDVIPSSAYHLYPLNETPKQQIALTSISGNLWQPNQGDEEGVISVQGIWGYHGRYKNAWQTTGASLAVTLSTSSTTADVTTGTLHAGNLTRMESELVYVDSVIVGATTDTVTFVRGINGSIAVSHTSATPIQVWNADLTVPMQVAVAASLRLRDNPIGDTIRIGNDTFSTPKGVVEYLERNLKQQGLQRVAIG